MKGVRGPRLYLRKWRSRRVCMNKRREWEEAYSQREAMAAFKQAVAAAPTLLHNNNNSSLLSTLLHTFSLYNSSPSPPAYFFLIQTLLQRSLFHQIPPLLRHLQSHASFPTPELFFSTLITSYGHARMLPQALHLFFSIPNFGCLPSALSLDALLSLLSTHPHTIPAIPLVLLKAHSLLNIRMEESTFRILISALCRIRKPIHAIELLNLMISNFCYALDRRICSAILDSLCGSSDEEEILCFFGGVKKLGFVPARMDYYVVIRAFVRRGSVDGAVAVLTEMKFSGMKPDTGCYNLVLGGAVEVENYEYAEQVFDEMLVLGLVPDVHTFDFYIKCQCRRGNLQEGMRILSAMDELGCKPSLYSYTLLLELLCEVGEFDGAKELMREAESKGVSPDSDTYGRMIHGLIRVRGDLPRACSLLEEMMQNHQDPLPYTVDDVVFGLCEKGCVSEAIFWINKLISSTTYPDSSTWTLLLKNTTFSDLGSELVTSLSDLSVKISE